MLTVNSGGAGLGAIIPVSSLATDAQAAAVTANYAAQNAGGNGYSAMQTPVVSVGVINSGGFSVLVNDSSAGSGTGYSLAPTPSATLLTSLGLSPSQTHFNNAQTAAILNAMQGVGAAPMSCFRLFPSDTCIGGTQGGGIGEITLMILLGGLALFFMSSR